MWKRFWSALVAGAIKAAFYANGVVLQIVDALLKWIVGTADMLYVDAVVTGNIAGTYANGTAGAGATITAAVNGAFATQDGVPAVIGQFYLLVGQTTAFQNGLYQLTTLGNASTAYVLTRAGAWNTSAKMINGFAFYAYNTNSVHGGQVWAYTGPTSPVVGTTGLTFAKDFLLRAIGSGAMLYSRRARAVIASALPAYANVAGVLTAAVNGALAAQDGVSLAVGDLVLLVAGASAADNGVYVVTALGSVTAPWVLTLSTDWTTGSVFPGSTVEVSEGTAWGPSSWKITTTGAIVVGTTLVAFYPRNHVLSGTLGAGTVAIASVWLYSGFKSIIPYLAAGAPVAPGQLRISANAAGAGSGSVTVTSTSGGDASLINVLVTNW